MSDQGLTASAIEAIRRMAQEAMTPRIVPAQSGTEPEGYYFIIDPQDKEHPVTQRKARRFRRLEMFSLESLIDYAVADGAEGSAAIFVADESVTFIESIDDGQDYATFGLIYSDQYAVIKSMRRERLYSQRDFINLLNIDVRGSLPTGSMLVDIVRSLRWSNQANTGSEIGHQKESLGKSVMADVTGKDAIPEGVKLSAFVYSNLLTGAADIDCAVLVHPSEQKFSIQPYPGVIDRIQIETTNEVMRIIREMLDGHKSKIPVYAGLYSV